jgi:DNA polymerase-1
MRQSFLIDHSGNSTNKIIPRLKQLLENKRIKKTGYNLKPSIQLLCRNNIELNGELFDTMVGHYLLEPENSHRLPFLAQTYLGIKTTRHEVRPAADITGINDISEITRYACENADISLQLSLVLEKTMAENNLSWLAKTIEMPLVSVLAYMEMEGFKLSKDDLLIYSEILKNQIIIVQNEIYGMAGEEFNISSPKQLGEILFDKLKVINDAKKTKTRQYQTGEEVLSKIADKHPIINKVLDYRALVKLLNTYVDALPLLINNKTGKIHTSFDQASVATGRLSSKNPNLQNIPVREERGREIRKAFVPGSGNVLVSADYSQIELRLMAHLSNDENMIEAFKRNADIHTATAAAIFNVPDELVTREMRSRAKTANFGIIYGISAFGLSQRLNIPRKEASAFIEGYFKTYPGVKEYMDNSIKEAREKGYVETIMGRRRYLNDINSANAVVRGFAERNAINAPLQGSAADIIKYAMVKIHDQLKDRFRSKMILQVHDELIFDVVPGEKDALIIMVRDQMESVISLKVPLIVDIGSGNNWLEAH